MKYKQSFQVDYTYEVHFTHNVFSGDNETLKDVLGSENSKCMFFLDENVHKSFPTLKKDIQLWCDNHPQSLNPVFPIHVVPGGEKLKMTFL